jgi:hypothetical protein
MARFQTGDRSPGSFVGRHRGLGGLARARSGGQSLYYRLYMRSALWRFRRYLWWARSHKRCEDCSCPLVLHSRDVRRRWDPLSSTLQPHVLTVHHLNYRRLGRELRADVALLCWSCHCRRDPFKGSA